MEFEQVYDLYFRDVYRYILKLSGSEHVAEEITSDTFYKQIGELFAKSDNWACVTYHRARNMIKNRLEDSNNEK